MNILAIDPGPVKSSWAFYAPNNKSPRFRFGTTTNHLMLCLIFLQDADILVIERIASYGMPVSETVFETVFWTGRFVEHAEGGRRQWDRITRKEIKLHLCNSLRANDAAVIQALKDRFGEKGTKKNPGLLYGIKGDEWQALAVAVAYAEGVRHEEKK